MVLERLYANLSITFIILKARQIGISTVIEAFIFWYCYITANQQASIIGHDAKASTNLFNMYKRFHTYLPEALKPVLKRSTAKEVTFKLNDSGAKIETAEGRDSVGRSGTVQIIHATEVAFYPDADATMTALMQSLFDDGFYFEESTANGLGGLFYNDWQDAKKGKNGMIPVFFAWHDNPEYSLEFTNKDERIKFANEMNDYDKKVMETYSLSLEQMHWRRKTIDGKKCRGDLNIFKQEYPSNDQEAFLTSGRPIFDVTICEANYKVYENFKPRRFDLSPTITADNKITSVTLKDNPNGYWTLLEDLDVSEFDEMRFSVGTDVAEGLEQGDYSTMDILDRKKMNYPIKFHGHIDPDILAVEQFKLQLFLKGKVYFCTERNNHGLTTISVANQIGLNQYYQGNWQKGYETPTQMIGFKTTSLTKPQIINQLNEAILESEFRDKDKEFWSECLTFARDEKGGMSAQGKSKDPSTKCYDDRIISKALSLHCHKWMPNYYRREEAKAIPEHQINDYSSYD